MPLLLLVLVPVLAELPAWLDGWLLGGRRRALVWQWTGCPHWRPHRSHDAPTPAPVLLRLPQATAFGMGGWWLGGGHLIPNPNFLAEVQASASSLLALLKRYRFCQHALVVLATA